MTIAKLPYCGELTRKYDSDRFLISLLMPPERREALWALFAFNHEIAKTREIVTETTIGLIRLQWWRDALAKIYEGNAAPENEILPDLQKAIRAHDLPRAWFDELLYAREFDLENIPPASLEGLEKYAEFTTAPLNRLALKITGQQENDETVRAVSIAYGLTGLIRAAPFHASQQRRMMPADLMAARGVNEYDLYDMKPGAGFCEVIRTVAASGQAFLKASKPRGKFLKAVGAASSLYLKQIKGLDYNVFDPRLAHGPAFYLLRFLMNSLL